MSESPARISASQVTLILQHAAEIDARGDSLTMDELRRIASEAGIDPAATEAAIEEVVAGGETAAVPVAAGAPGVPAVPEEDGRPRVPAKASKSPSPGWIVAGGAVGTAMGFITMLAGPTAFVAFGAAILFLLLRAVQSMKQGAQLDFQLQSFAVWFGMLIGSASSGIFAGEAVIGAFLVWIVTSVVGGLLVRFGPRDEEADEDRPQLGPGARRG